jgi:hypothetical protein
MSRHWATRLALPDMPIIVLEHPIAHLPTAEIEARGEAAADRVVQALTQGLPA